MKDIIKYQNAIISPYDDRNIDQLSPDLTKRAMIRNSLEFAMSAPVICEIEVGCLSLKMSSPSIIWSDDSLYLAFPMWRWKNHSPYWIEIVYVLNIQSKVMRSVPGSYFAITLTKFIGKTIYAIHNEKNIEIDTSKIKW